MTLSSLVDSAEDRDVEVVVDSSQISAVMCSGSYKNQQGVGHCQKGYQGQNSIAHSFLALWYADVLMHFVPQHLKEDDSGKVQRRATKMIKSMYQMLCGLRLKKKKSLFRWKRRVKGVC